MYRVINMGHPRTFLDPSILKFFLLQPMGLAMETLVVVPFCDATFGVRWRNAITRTWTWMFMLFLGMYWSDMWVSSGLWDENEKVVGISVNVRRNIYQNRFLVEQNPEPSFLMSEQPPAHDVPAELSKDEDLSALEQQFNQVS